MSKYREWDLSCKVYVGNLGSSASKYEIERIFCKYGPIKNVWVARNPPGFAFVEFEDGRDAEDSVRGLDRTRCCGTRIRVEMSSGRTRRDAGRRCQRPVSIITTTTNYITTTSTTNLPHLLLHNRLPTAMAIRSALQPATDSANRSTCPPIVSTDTILTFDLVIDIAPICSTRQPIESAARCLLNNTSTAFSTVSSSKLNIHPQSIDFDNEDDYSCSHLPLTEISSTDSLALLHNDLKTDHRTISSNCALKRSLQIFGLLPWIFNLTNQSFNSFSCEKFKLFKRIVF